MPEPDEEIGGEPDEPPADEEQEEVARLHEHEHREDEERHVREVPALLVVAGHVAHRVPDDQPADAGDDEHHHARQRIEEDLEVDVEVAGGEPRVRRGDLLALGRVLAVKPYERDDGASEGDEGRERRDPAGSPPRDVLIHGGDHGCPHEGRQQADPGTGDHVSRRSASECVGLVDVECDPAPRHCDDQPEAHGDLPGRDGHHGEREDLAVERSRLARERDEREVPGVEHDLEREQDDQRAPPKHHAHRPRREQDPRDDEIPADAGTVYVALSFSRVVPSTTPPTAATRRTMEVISKASRWSVRNSSPISPGLPKPAVTSGGSES